MDFIKICGFAALCGTLTLIIASREKELTALANSLLYVIIMLYAITRASKFIESIKAIFTYGSEIPYLNYILSIIGIATVGTVASSICENSGQKSISSSIELMAVIEIFIIATPIFKDLLTKAMSLF